jgi:hypothetical protein
MPATLKNQVYAIIKKIRALHPEDTRIYEYWDEMTALLTTDENATIDFLMNCNDAETIDDISSSFADISYKLQSQRFIDCLDVLEKKFPQILIKHMISAAKDYMPDSPDENEDIL